MSSKPSSQDNKEHETMIKTPQQLIVVVLLGFLVPIILIILIVELVTGGKSMDMASPVMSAEEVAKRIQPVAKYEIVDINAPKTFRLGEEIVKSQCLACHGTGVLNAPKMGDKATWSKLTKEGLNSLLKTAIAGKGNMPPRGGDPALSDLELARAIVYMANQSGAALKEPAIPLSKTTNKPGK